MGNPIKYSTTVTSGSYQKGNVAIGTNPIGYGPTANTGWYNGVSPEGGNFIITEVVDGNTLPRFYAPITDNDWFRLARQEGATGANTGSTAAIKNWVASQANYVITNIDFPLSMPNVVGNGLVLNLEAGTSASYPGTGTTWTDISGLGNNVSLVNGPTFSPLGGIIFDGVDDYAINSNLKYSPFTYNVTFKGTSGYISRLFGYGWGLFISSNNVLAAWVDTNTSHRSTTTYISYNNSLITNFSIVFTGSAFSLYKNGVFLQTVATPTDSVYSTTTQFCIGTDTVGSGPFNGTIYSAQLYNKGLTQTEILQNYYQGNIITDSLVYAIDASNLVSYESGSTTSYSLTGSNTGYLWYGTEFTSNNGGTFKFGNNRSTTIQSISASDYNSSPINLPGYGSYTISTWVKRTAFGTWKSGNTNYDGIWNYYWDHSLAFTGENTGVNGIYGTGLNAYTINMNQWYNIVVTHKDYNVQSTNNHKTYLNGVLISTATITNPTLEGGLPKRFYIGNWDTSWSMVGEIANLQIYSKELSSTEINQNFNAYRGKFGI
jgi:hypothetical protein